MLEQLLLSFLSAIIGGFIGTLISTSLPQVLFNPRIKITKIILHGFHWQLVVINKGKTAANNAVGRITIHPINQGDIVGTIEEINETRKHLLPDDWKKSRDAYLRAEEWQTGIEAEHIFWLTSLSKDTAHTTIINPNLPERLALAYSAGPWVDIPSERTNKKRARLKLNDKKIYYGEVVVGSANSSLSKPFCFQIRLGPNGTAIIEPDKEKWLKLLIQIKNKLYRK